MGEKSITGRPRVTVGPYCKGATSKSSVADPDPGDPKKTGSGSYLDMFFDV